ncbi:MAG TPA: hypothetical protein VJR50_19325, partial [Mycobacterium sp.]|nr:hypothetical protein [Mycobacterium sp.]
RPRGCETSGVGLLIFDGGGNFPGSAKQLNSVNVATDPNFGISSVYGEAVRFRRSMGAMHQDHR